MKFIVTRSSSRGSDNSPLENCQEEDVVRYDKRTFKSPEEHDERFSAFGSKWTDEGSNHRLWENGIVRDFPDKVWVVSFENLENLISFVDKHGDVIISQDSGYSLPEIEIYDDHRE